MSGLKIAYVTTYNSSAVDGAWSGTGYWIGRALEEQGAIVTRISSLGSARSRFSSVYHRTARLRNTKFIEEIEPIVTKKLANEVDSILEKNHFDLILSPGYFPVAYLKSNLPLVLWGDATFDLLCDYYPNFQRISWHSKRVWDRLERRAQRKASLLMYCSKWAAASATTFYKTPSQKIAVVPFGANMEHVQNYTPPKKQLPSEGQPINLLLVGVDWFTKGVDIACGAVVKLNSMGLNVHLDIVGCEAPISKVIPENISVHGFISKDSQSGQNHLTTLFENAHILIHPSRAECYGIVMCEANSFGVPVVAHNTGGISEIIHHDENGLLYDNNDADSLALAIETMTRDKRKYIEYSHTAGTHYLNRLNWKSAGSMALNLIEELVLKGK